ncbi:DUF4249 domain-containing protein [Mucilaginibacter angelicae]|uniref:DUF4249 domain-containing protein n=1 Tax=Mucilaginibacter angelicae TaxID=869718 RepID=A0ABV6LHT5_9SPHI
MIRKKKIWFLLLAGFAFITCKKSYNPKIISDPNSYLVVEGIISSGNDSTIVKLSKTVKITDDVKTAVVDNCTVSVEDEGGNGIALKPEGNGLYTSPVLGLDVTKKYRLHIITSDSKEYASDYVEVKKNPPVDSIGFTIKQGNLQIYVNTHDVTNNTRYYRWSYEEAWRFHSKYSSSYIVDQIQKKVVPRPSSEQNYYCFTGDLSSTIVIGSSAKLTQDVIYQAPVTTISPESEKIELRYSILVKQYALTKEAYQFWENLKKNTEQLGSIFDAQPSQLTGNIHNLKNAAEPVIGYISITNTQTKRVFIDNADLPREWVAKYPYDCEADSALFYNPISMQDEVRLLIIDGNGIPIQGITKSGQTAGYTYSTLDCVDCRIRGRVQAPSFWIERK